MCNNAEELCHSICPEFCPGDVFFDGEVDLHGWPDMRQMDVPEVSLEESQAHDTLLMLGVGGSAYPDVDEAPPAPVQMPMQVKTVHHVSYARFASDQRVVAAVALPYLDRRGKLSLRRHPRLLVVMGSDGCLFCVVKPLVLPPKER